VTAPIAFVAQGTPRVVSRAIEEFAQSQGHVTAIVVPWESSATMLSMSVTSVKTDGWAIEHTNLGTVTLTDAGNDTTAVAVLAAPSGHADPEKLATVFDRFARSLQSRFESRP
jgi:hypothetical protein